MTGTVSWAVFIGEQPRSTDGIPRDRRAIIEFLADPASIGQAHTFRNIGDKVLPEMTTGAAYKVAEELERRILTVGLSEHAILHDVVIPKARQPKRNAIGLEALPEEAGVWPDTTSLAACLNLTGEAYLHALAALPRSSGRFDAGKLATQSLASLNCLSTLYRSLGFGTEYRDQQVPRGSVVLIDGQPYDATGTFDERLGWLWTMADHQGRFYSRVEWAAHLESVAAQSDPLLSRFKIMVRQILKPGTPEHVFVDILSGTEKHARSLGFPGARTAPEFQKIAPLPLSPARQRVRKAPPVSKFANRPKRTATKKPSSTQLIAAALATTIARVTGHKLDPNEAPFLVDIAKRHVTAGVDIGLYVETAEAPDHPDWPSVAICDDIPNPLAILFAPGGETPDEQIERENRARDMCGICAVRAQCLKEIIEQKTTGISAGLNHQERKTILRRIKALTAEG